MKDPVCIALDIGGTWLKVAAVMIRRGKVRGISMIDLQASARSYAGGPCVSSVIFTGRTKRMPANFWNSVAGISVRR